MKRLLLLFFLIFPCALPASDAQQYEAGKGFALKNQASQPQDAKNIPGYQGTIIPEASLSQGNLQEALQQKMTEKNNSASFISETHDQRLRFTIDPAKDPIFTESDRIVGSPLETLKARAAEIDEPVTEEKSRHTCEEAGDAITYSCQRELIVTVTLSKGPQVEKNFTVYYPHLISVLWSIFNLKLHTPLTSQALIARFYQAWDKKNYSTGELFTLELTDITSLTWTGYSGPQITIHQSQGYSSSIPQLAHLTITYASTSIQSEEAWDSSACGAYEDKVDQGLCFYEGKTCTQGPQTRLINGQPVTRECWQENLTYRCEYPSQNTCDSLKAQGCHQINSTCKEKVGNTCIIWVQTYECIKAKRSKQTTVTGKDLPFCLDGQCNSNSWEANADMMDALSKLMIFKEIQKDKDMLASTIFKGEEYGCNRNCVDFKDCCGKGKGWGVSLGLAGCSEKEKALAKLREEKKCVCVGTYCAEKVLGVCIRKKTNFCCFGTKLARVIHEQGRLQLGVGFGDAENPHCRGFTVEELSQLDFEKINLSELLAEFYATFKAPNMSKLSQDLSEDWKHRIPKMEKEKNPPLQAVKESQKDATF